MKGLAVLVTAVVILAACGGTQGATTGMSAPASAPTAVSQPDVSGCPPPPAPVMHSTPPPAYLRFGVREQDPVVDAGHALQITAYLENIAKESITLVGEPPSLDVYQAGALVLRPVWSLPLDAWRGATLQPGRELTADVRWPGGQPGVYQLDFGEFRYSLTCEQMTPRTSGGGTWIHVRLPAGQALQETLEPRRSVTADGITVRIDQVRLDAEETHVKVWVSRLRAPAGLHLSLFRDGGGILGGTGLGNRDAPGGGVEVEGHFGPVPKDTRTLTIQVSDIGLVTPGVGVTIDHGPWRLVVPLATGTTSSFRG